MKVFLAAILLLVLVLRGPVALPFLVDLTPYVEHYKPQVDAAL